MNFASDKSPWNMPELGWYFGYPFCLGLMVATVGGLLVYFRRLGWIGPAARAQSAHAAVVTPQAPATR
jgi:hypothetical protein